MQGQALRQSRDAACCQPRTHTHKNKLTFAVFFQHVDVTKLCKAKPLDNLEMLQWIKRYFDMHYGGAEYNAVERRGGLSFAKENAGSNTT